MPTAAMLKIRGLHTSANQLSGVPEGGMVRANNVVIPSADTLESRRGQRYESNSFGGGSDRARALAFFRSGKVGLYGTTLAYSTTLDGAWTALSGSYTEPDPTLLRMKFVELALNLYFTTSLGLYQMESLSSTPKAAGVPKAQMIVGRPATAAGSYLASDRAVGYSAVWGIKDANGNVKLGPPSEMFAITTGTLTAAIGKVARTAPDGSHPAGKVTVSFPRRYADSIFLRYSVGDVLTLAPGEGNFAVGNKTVVTVGATATEQYFTYDEAGAVAVSTLAQVFTSAARGAELQVYLPTGVSSTSGHFVRIYRSLIASSAISSPSADMFQVGEQKPTASDDSAGFLTFLDNTPDTMLLGSPPLYTSPNVGDGFAAANYSPPLAKDIFEFDGRMWMLNLTEKGRFTLNLLGIGTPNGAQASDTIGIAGQTYTFVAGAPAAGTDTRIFTTGSASQNIEDTARQLCYTVNVNASSSVWAYYVSGVDDAPGRILFEEKSIGGAAFVLIASRATSWYPALPTSGTTITSDNARNAAGLAFSKTGQPEAVPLTNRMADLPRGKAAIRAVPLKDKVFVFVDGVGIWVLSGPAPYRTERFDTTAKLLVPDSVVEHSNQLMAWTDQGTAAISDGGVRLISPPIEFDLLDYLATVTLADLRAYAFAVSYEADRQYQLWMPITPSDNVCRQAWVYNSLRDGWTRWTGYRSCGGINPADGKLYLGDGQTNKLRVERKDYTTSDYADESLAVTVSSGAADGLSAVLASATGVAAGDVLTRGTPEESWLITAVNTNTLTLLTGGGGVVPTGAATVLKAIPCAVKFCHPRSQDPAIQKQYREINLHFAFHSAYKMPVFFDSEISRGETTPKTTWATSWLPGSYEYPSSVSQSAITARNLAVEVPPEHQRCTQLQVGFSCTEAVSRWRLNGYSLSYEMGSEKTGRT